MDALYLRLLSLAERMRSDEEGQAMVEYALILVLIAIAVIVALQTLGGDVSNTYNDISSALQ